MPVVKPVSKYAKVAGTAELVAEAAENIQVGDAVAVRRRFGETLIKSFSTSSKVLCAAYTPDNTKLLVGTYDKKLTVYKASNYSSASSIELPGIPRVLVVKPDSTHAAILLTGTSKPDGSSYGSTQHNTICVYDVATLELLWWHDMGEAGTETLPPCSALAYSSKGRYLAASNINAKSITIFNATNVSYTEAPSPVGFQVSQPAVNSFAYSRDDSLMAIAYSGYIGLYDTTGEYPLEVAFVKASNTVSPTAEHTWSYMLFNEDSTRLYHALQNSGDSRGYFTGYEVTRSSITTLPNHEVYSSNSGLVCAFTPDAVHVLESFSKDFDPRAAHNMLHIACVEPISEHVADLPGNGIATDRISYALFEPSGASFVLFGCALSSPESAGTAYVYSCKKYLYKASIDNTKSAVSVGYATSSSKAGSNGAISILY